MKKSKNGKVHKSHVNAGRWIKSATKRGLVDKLHDEAKYFESKYCNREITK